MNIVFTLCSNNYLAQAKALGDSLVLYNTETKFIIGLVDRMSKDIDYSFFLPYDIIPVEEIGIENLSAMAERYDIVEFNTAVKPFYFLFLLAKYKPQKIYYFDPDILIFNSISVLNEELEHSNIVLTPHLLHHSNDKYGNHVKGSYSLSFKRSFSEQFIYWELQAIKYGLYNLGFIGISNNEESYKFLEWWKYRTFNYGDNDPGNSLFVDQLWVNLVPVFFEKVTILKHPGLNMAHWNLHERNIEKKNGKYYINSEYPLVFFHYSSFNPRDTTALSRYDKATDIEINDNLIELTVHYREELLKNKFEFLAGFKCALSLKKEPVILHQDKGFYNRLKGFLKRKIKEMIS